MLSDGARSILLRAHPSPRMQAMDDQRSTRRVWADRDPETLGLGQPNLDHAELETVLLRGLIGELDRLPSLQSTVAGHVHDLREVRPRIAPGRQLI